MEFELSSHEVMRGIAARRGALVLRPNGWVLAGSAADALVGAVLVGLAVAGGGLWWITAVPGAWLVVDGLARLRVAVVATDQDIVARNRWRTHRIAISDVQAISAETVDWWLRQPAYVLTRSGLTGREWLVGTIRAAGGRSCRCDALISQPGGPGPASGLERCGGRVRWEQRCVRPAVVLDACVAHHRSMSTPTFIAVLDFSVSASDRSMAVAQLEREGSTIRSMPGCVAFRVFPAQDTDTDVTVLHEWTDRAAFDGYLASDAFARSGEILRPLMTAPPVSRRFHVGLVEAAV